MDDNGADQRGNDAVIVQVDGNGPGSGQRARTAGARADDSAATRGTGTFRAVAVAG